jgi:hypothetical protein
LRALFWHSNIQLFRFLSIAIERQQQQLIVIIISPKHQPHVLYVARLVPATNHARLLSQSDHCQTDNNNCTANHNPCNNCTANNNPCNNYTANNTKCNNYTANNTKYNNYTANNNKYNNNYSANNNSITCSCFDTDRTESTDLLAVQCPNWPVSFISFRSFGQHLERDLLPHDHSKATVDRNCPDVNNNKWLNFIDENYETARTVQGLTGR